MHSKRLRFQKGDLIAIGAVVLLAAVIFALLLPQNGKNAAYAEIYQDGQLVKTVSLWENQEFTITGQYENIIAVRDGKIAVIASDCPGEDCVRCGWVEGNGRSVVCLPNGVEIRIVAEQSDVDFVVG